MAITSGSLTPIVRARATAICMAIISTVLGLGIMIYDGLMVSLPQFQLFWLMLGAGAFYLPGVAYGLAWWGLKSGRTWAVIVGIVAAVGQAMLAIALAVGNFVSGLGTSGMLIVECGLWATACIILALQLKRALPWVAQDADAHHGFEVAPLPQSH